MDSPTSRTLHLLALLQTGRAWTLDELSRHMDIGSRTVRRDVARLRALGYDVRSSPGPGGAYRLVPSVKIPPLLLDADEVCTLVTALLILEAGSPEAGTVRSKLEQLLPPTLRRRATATAMATHILTPAAATTDWPLLGVLAEAVATGRHVRFTYIDQHDRRTEREVQPHRYLLREGCWYLIGFDVGRADWRLFRLDRIQDARDVAALTHDDPPPFPSGSIEQWLTTDFGRTPSDAEPRHGANRAKGPGLVPGPDLGFADRPRSAP